MWKPAAGFDYYEVSDSGEVRSIDRVVPRGTGTLRVDGRILSPVPNAHGYLAVFLYPAHSRRYVHRLVLEAFVGPCPEGLECRHLDDDPANNCLDNLAWGTRSQNRFDLVRNGNHHHAKRTHCRQGHPLSGANVLVRTDGGRRCRKCKNARSRKAA